MITPPFLRHTILQIFPFFGYTTLTQERIFPRVSLNQNTTERNLTLCPLKDFVQLHVSASYSFSCRSGLLRSTLIESKLSCDQDLSSLWSPSHIYQLCTPSPDSSSPISPPVDLTKHGKYPISISIIWIDTPFLTILNVKPITLIWSHRSVHN